MNRRKFLLLASTSVLTKGFSVSKAFSDAPRDLDEVKPQPTWELFIEQPNQAAILVESFVLPESGEHVIKKSLDSFNVEASIRRADSFWVSSAKVRSSEPGRKCFLSLTRSYGENSKPLNFNGEVIENAVYRQRPFNSRTSGYERVMQSVPLVALLTPQGTEVAICDTPAHFENCTTQTYDLQARQVRLSSGDHGLSWNVHRHAFEPVVVEGKGNTDDHTLIEPHYFSLEIGQDHTMETILMRFPKSALDDYRQQVNLGISQYWSKGTTVDLLGATCFSTAYMNLRVNDTGKSRYWVIPAIEYANKQYSRDAFWISMMLSPEYSQSCFENEAANDTVFTGAERQLFTLVWAYRNHRNGFAVDKARMERILRIVETHAPDGFYSGFSSTQSPKIGCWQGWADTIAFDHDDTISNNQGLFVVALLCAQAMNIETKISAEQALDNYRGLYSTSLGAYPVSRKRTDILAVDPLMGDLLSQVYFGKQLLPTDHVLAHYRAIMQKARTANGFKVFCAADGSYLRPEQYNSKEFIAFKNSPDGNYQCGGSWYLYDMQMLMDAYLHGAADAEDQMIWRTKLEFLKGGTTHEYINTVTGQAFKPNMGWNGGVCGLWKEITKKGLASDCFFREIDKLRS